MTAPDLLPCPWCGSPAELERGSDHHGEWFNLGCSRHWGAVGPENACLGGRLFYTETEVAESVAAARWNTRAAPAATDPKFTALVSREAATAREVFEDYGSKAKEAIDYMEQLLLAALRAGGDA